MLRFIENFLLPLRSGIRISIHLMLRFIGKYCVRQKGELQNFNTSHVTVYLIALLKIWDGICDFNTSHVTVYHILRTYMKEYIEFQYISCYGLSGTGSGRYFSKIGISIHLMLRFIKMATK